MERSNDWGEIPVTSTNPLGRDSMPFAETMARHFSTIENALYAAEQVCPVTKERQASYDDGWAYPCGRDCHFRSVNGFCKINGMRLHFGYRVEQHDPTPGVPPCQFGKNWNGFKEGIIHDICTE